MFYKSGFKNTAFKNTVLVLMAGSYEGSYYDIHTICERLIRKK